MLHGSTNSCTHMTPKPELCNKRLWELLQQWRMNPDMVSMISERDWQNQPFQRRFPRSTFAAKTILLSALVADQWPEAWCLLWCWRQRWQSGSTGMRRIENCWLVQPNIAEQVYRLRRERYNRQQSLCQSRRWHHSAIFVPSNLRWFAHTRPTLLLSSSISWATFHAHWQTPILIQPLSER